MIHESDSVVLTLPWLDVMRQVQRIRLVIRLLNTSSGSLLMWGGLFNSTRMAHLRKERSLVQKHLYNLALKSVKLATRLKKSRGGNSVNICNFGRSVA
jgi:hypothetical protein